MPETFIVEFKTDVVWNARILGEGMNDAPIAQNSLSLYNSGGDM